MAAIKIKQKVKDDKMDEIGIGASLLTYNLFGEKVKASE